MIKTFEQTISSLELDFQHKENSMYYSIYYDLKSSQNLQETIENHLKHVSKNTDTIPIRLANYLE